MLNLNDFVHVALYKNTAQGGFIEVIQETEKAVKIKSDQNDNECTLWIPKSAFGKFKTGTDSFFIKPWFLKNITDKTWKKNIFLN